jgi:hypothetical protein
MNFLNPTRFLALAVLACMAPCALWAQGLFDPAGAQVYSYFPQFADGGPASQKWITSFTFVNPHVSDAAAATLYLMANNGAPLTLDLGGGPGSQFNFTVPPQGSVTFTSTAQSASLVTGWAEAVSSLPLQSAVQFRDLTNGVPQQGVSAQATPASLIFRSPATSTTGIAVANPYNANVAITVAALNASGAQVGIYNLTLGPEAHQSFNLNQILPALGNSFRGSVTISGGSYFVAWALSGDGGVLSSYPVAGLALPPAQYERIWRIWQKVAGVANDGHLLKSWPQLVIDPNSSAINSYACGVVSLGCTAQDLNSVHIFLNIAEMTSDSDGELAFIVAHELGHIIQAWRGLVYVPQDREWDADSYGFRLALLAGYDPYGGMGMLGKLYTLTTDPRGFGLLAPNFDGGSGDQHGSLMQRLAIIWATMQTVCADPQIQSFCASYKSVFHPLLPGAVPLDRSASAPLDTPVPSKTPPPAGDGG